MEDSGPEAENVNVNDYPADEDSDHIEEESTSSHLSGQSSGSAPNWRYWRVPPPSGRQLKHVDNAWRADDKSRGSNKTKSSIDSLVDICARYVGRQFPFEAVERCLNRIPDVLQLKIAFYSFPEDEASIRLYSCLANGSVDEFVKGEQLYKSNIAISDVSQIGFHLSATLTVSPNHPPSNEVLTSFRTSVMFDRRKITACSCSCVDQKRSLCSCGASRPQRANNRNDVLNSAAISCVCGEGKRIRSSQTWCSHVVALCLFRINEHDRVQLRTPISETLGKLERNQLQKFAQFLISKLPVQNLTVAQQILDELLSTEPNDVNMACGAPDPTSGGSWSEYAGWLLDEKAVEDKLAVAISEFVKPAPQIYSDIQTLSAEASPISTEYNSLLRPLRGYEPEGVWNLLHIVRHMFRKQDSNAIVLLQIVTRKILDAGKILLWWFQTKMLVGEDHGGMKTGGLNSRGCARNGAQCNNYSQSHQLYYHQQYAGGQNPGSNAENAVCQRYAAASLCDEIVALWRIGALNPALDDENRALLCAELITMHKIVFDCVQKQCTSNNQNNNQNPNNHVADWCSSEEGLSLFTRFRPAIEACLVPWEAWKRKYSILRVANGAVFNNHYAKTLPETYDVIAIVRGEVGAVNIQAPPPDSIEEIFARAEAFYAHGYTEMASELARELCGRLLENPPVFIAEPPVAGARSGPFRNEYLQCVSVGQMLSRAQFLLNVLSGDQHHWPAAFRVGLSAIDIPRPPCFSKFLEVKLVFQEREVVECLRRLPALGPEEISHVRQKALQLCSGLYSQVALRPPITLAGYIFEILSSSLLNSSDDHDLGFQSALEGIGFKLPVCEADHPMLYESFRHQKGELAIQLLMAYKDEVPKLERVLDKLLDRQIEVQKPSSSSSSSVHDIASSSSQQNIDQDVPSSSVGVFRRVQSEGSQVGPDLAAEDSSALEDEQEDRRMAARLRCVLTIRPNQAVPNQQQANLAQARGGFRPSGPDSSAPETTSSDNSPTFSRRAGTSSWRMPQSLSFNLDSGNQQIRAQMQQQARSGSSKWGSNTKSGSGGNSNGPSRVLQPTEPNQPSEAAAQFVFELAKEVLQKAGGNSTQTYFQRPVQTRPHAALHMCAFQIGLHALALHNAVTLTWLSRLYSTYGSWIITQAIEIGVPALRLLIEAWEGHLTPSEVARLADQAGRVPDRQVIRSSVELAYRALEFASCLTVAEVRRALDQCEELSLDKVKSACAAVEQSAIQTGSVPQDILFATAEKLMDIYHKLHAKAATSAPPSVVHSHVAHHAHQNLQPQIPHQQLVPSVVQAALLPPQQQPQMMPHNAAMFNPQGYPNVPFQAYNNYNPYQNPNQAYLFQMNNSQGQYQFVPMPMYPAQYGQQPMYDAGQNAAPFGLHHPVLDHHQMQAQFGLPQLPPQMHAAAVQPLPPQQQQQQQQQVLPPPPPPQVNETTNYFLLAAYRVGMLAMEQIRRNNEDKPVTIKISKAPPPLLGNVKWLFHTAVVIGPEKVDEVCRLVLVAIPDGAVLQEMCDLLEEYMAGLMQGANGGPSSLQASLGPLQQTWNQMYHKALTNYRATINHKTAHLLQAEQEDFMHMLTNAKRLFTKTPSGTKQFNEVLTIIKKSKTLRKDYAQKLLKNLALHRSDGAVPPHAMF